ncbi:hypothetical protein MD484_g165, partial [Candolleomyces efflorescens]
MHARYIAALLVASAASVFASPNPAALEARQGIISDVVDGATSIFGQATSVAGDVGDAVTSHAHRPNFFFLLLAVGGQAFTVVTSVGGEAITLAASGAGVATSKFGSVYTVATSAAGAQITGNSDSGAQSLQGRSTLLVGAATIVGSALLGAFITF